MNCAASASAKEQGQLRQRPSVDFLSAEGGKNLLEFCFLALDTPWIVAVRCARKLQDCAD